MSYFYSVNHYTATITVGQKTYKAKTAADSPEIWGAKNTGWRGQVRSCEITKTTF